MSRSEIKVGTKTGYPVSLTGVISAMRTMILEFAITHQEAPPTGELKMNAIVDGRRLGSKRRVIVIGLLLALISLSATPANAQARLVVRDSLGLSGLNLICPLLGCNVVRSLGDPQGQLFLITFPSILNPVTALLKINLQLGIFDPKIHQSPHTLASSPAPPPPHLPHQ